MLINHCGIFRPDHSLYEETLYPLPKRNAHEESKLFDFERKVIRFDFEVAITWIWISLYSISSFV